MNDKDAYGDALTLPYWAAATEQRLVIQRCTDCGHHQHYPRPFCMKCEGNELEWTDAKGTGTVYTRTIVHLQISPDLVAPYAAAVVELDEGPHLTTNLTSAEIGIGDRVKVAWREREGMPPFPVFERA
ncbi:MAG: Zn-ribbon domain-containing OB-fold protein [Candidatus Dormibacteria bacterium]